MEPRVLEFDAKGDGPPIVIVPGGLTGWASWVGIQERLARRYRAIRVQPIHNELGSAGVPGDPSYTAVTEREALRMTFDALGLASAHVVGWSAGGRAVIEFAMEYPDRCRSLALVEPDVLWIIEQLGERPDEVARELAALHRLFGRPVTEDDLVWFLAWAAFAPNADAARTDPGFPRWMEHRTALSWQGPRLDHPDRTVDELSRITCPVILFRGSTTTDLQKRMVDAVAERLPDARVVELEGGHASQFESEDAFVDALERHVVGAERAATSG